MSYWKLSRLCKIRIVKDLKIALREVEEGKTRPLNELIRELNLESEI